MLNSIFVRIYLGLVLTVLIVSGLGLLVLQQINQSREVGYRESLASGTMHLLASQLAEQDPLQRGQSLTAWSRLFAAPMRLLPPQALALSPLQLARLEAHDVVVVPSGEQELALFQTVNDDLVLNIRLNQVSEQWGRATLFIVMDELLRAPEAERQAYLAKLNERHHFGIPVRLFSPHQAGLDADQFRRLDEGDTVITLAADGDAVTIYLGVVGSREVLGLGPILRFNPYPPSLMLLIAVMVMLLIGLTLYGLVYRLERRVETIERAASDIAAGSLDTRVPIRGRDSVGRLASRFNDMAARLQRLIVLQREMIRGASHELRTPVARLRFGLEMLEQARDEERRQRYLKGMDGDLQELDKLIDEILTYARLEQGNPALTFERVDVQAILQQAADELGPLRQAVHIEVMPVDSSLSEDRWLTDAAQFYLNRAVQNLLSNALRHATGQVRLTYRVDRHRCQIDVEDDGPGIAQSDWENLFTPFMRLDDSRTRSSGGYGLGLSIVRRVIYWHGGRALVAHSQSLGGAKFSLIWPRRQNLAHERDERRVTKNYTDHTRQS
ncbi:ATP-binding protein [Atopomonas sediminilitoris]|uniref:ATP-binding protein n=1 Tax=Atopomonas sediminilitoris TaxID=2919919 RepID=UPI001F4EA048|nr:ATP-binding protein [Atopomonas sediminilitoris]MCJ8169114.1 ATP-binding protein [Atopomonas sediminilitoris]